MANYILSPNAQKSLNQIKTYSESKFGSHQTILYLKKLRDRMRYLGENPNHGKARDDIKHGYYNHPEGSHMVYYVIDSKGIGIIDILHQSMDPELHIS